MAAIPAGMPAYITKAPSWSKKGIKLGRLAYPKGVRPAGFKPFPKGKIQVIADRCKQESSGAGVVLCINQIILLTDRFSIHPVQFHQWVKGDPLIQNTYR